MTLNKAIALIFFILMSTTACTIHRIEVQQGNIIKPELLKQLKPGISMRQVQFIMGTPLIQDPFHPNRWDYVFTLQPGDVRKITKYQHVAVFFKDDKLVKVEKHL